MIQKYKKQESGKMDSYCFNIIIRLSIAFYLMSQNRPGLYKYDYAWLPACSFIYYNILKILPS
jgi:hypothetical protein